MELGPVRLGLIPYGILIISFSIARIHSNSTDDNNLLIHEYNCTPGDYYDLKHGCVRCTSCTRENFKIETPCSLHSDAICGDCEDGYEKQQQGESITCEPIQSSDDNEDIAHPGDNSNRDLGSSSASHYNTTVAHKSPERINVDSDSDDGKRLKSIANNEITSIMILVVVILAILTTVLAIVGLRYCHKKVTKDNQNIPVTNNSSTTTTASEDSGENDGLIKVMTEQPQTETLAKTQSSLAGQCMHNSSTATTASEDSGENDHLIEVPHTEHTEPQTETLAKTLSSPAKLCIQRETSSSTDANTSVKYTQVERINLNNSDFNSSSSSNPPITSIEARDLSAS